MEASVSIIGFFLPIFSFLLVFVVLYSVLARTNALGESKGVNLFVSFVLASFFIMEASLVNFVVINSAWVGVFAITIFFVVLTLSFLPGKEPELFLRKGNWSSWVILGAFIALFIFSAAHVFNWVIDWAEIHRWIATDWFGMILLLIIAGITSFVITREVKKKKDD